MTAIALYMAGDRVLMAADAAAYDLTGRVSWFRHKLMVMDTLKCVVTCAGIWSFGDEFAAAARHECSSFDEIVSNMPALARKAYAVSAENWRSHGTEHAPPPGLVIIAGWSDARSKLEAYKIHSGAKPVVDARGGIATTAPWTVYPIDEFYCSSRPTFAGQAICGLTGEWWNTLTPEEIVGRFVCSLRAQGADSSGAPDYGEGVYGVGGWVQIVEISRDNIRCWVPHVWPDEVGRPIHPDAGRLLPSTFSWSIEAEMALLATRFQVFR